jgi:hypothetical protein
MSPGLCNTASLRLAMLLAGFCALFHEQFEGQVMTGPVALACTASVQHTERTTTDPTRASAS